MSLASKLLLKFLNLSVMFANWLTAVATKKDWDPSEKLHLMDWPVEQ